MTEKQYKDILDSIEHKFPFFPGIGLTSAGEHKNALVQSFIKLYEAQKQWQLMDTAPRDGTAVMATGIAKGRTTYDTPVIVRFRNGSWNDNEGLIHGWITHWMPIPEFPMPLPESIQQQILEIPDGYAYSINSEKFKDNI